MPYWIGTKGEFEIVAVAETLLDMLDLDKDNDVNPKVSTEKFQGASIKLSKFLNCFEEATYPLEAAILINPYGCVLLLNMSLIKNCQKEFTLKFRGYINMQIGCTINCFI